MYTIILKALKLLLFYREAIKDYHKQGLTQAKTFKIVYKGDIEIMATNELIEKKYCIDTNNLKVGQVFKNYRHMCSCLNQDALKADSKEAQLKEWRRYIEWVKEGQKIIITDIYDTPLDRTDGRVTNGTQKYQQYIEDILLAYMDSEINKNNVNNIKGCSDYQFIFTLNGLALLCNMVNKRYVSKNIDSVLLEAGYTKFNIKDFFSRTELKFSLIINNALKNMEKRKIINYNKVLIIEQNGEQRIASVHDENDYLNMEKLTLTEMGYNSIVEVFIYNKTKEYYSLVDKKIKKHLNWDKCYKAYVINLNNRSIDLEKAYLKQTNQQNKLKLNQKLIDFFNSQAKNKYIKSCKNELNGFRLPSNYNQQQIGLTDYLLKIDG